jgi:Arc/MetJ-type ribon-helix-helix transcriptional regulator
MWKTGSWKAARARAPDMAAAIKAMSKKPVRFGEYGNMSSVPREVVEKLLKAADRWTLYEHEWRKDSNQWLNEYAMASVHSEAEALEAQAMGWRTFRERGEDDPLMDNEIQCPHRTHGVQCVDCLLCDGHRMTVVHRRDRVVLRSDKRKNISEIAH